MPSAPVANLNLGPDTVALSGRWRWVPKFFVPAWEVRYGNIGMVERIDFGVYKAVRFYRPDSANRLWFVPKDSSCIDEVLDICKARGVPHVVRSTREAFPPNFNEGRDQYPPSRPRAVASKVAARLVAVVATIAMAGGVSTVVATLVRERPIPYINALLIPGIVVAGACGVWVSLVLSNSNPREGRPARRRIGAWVRGFAHENEWRGLPRRVRVLLGCIGLVSFFVAASANPSLGGYNNNPSLSRCSGVSRGLSCVVHQHALAAQQRFFTAIFVGFFTFVLGVALSYLHSGSGAIALPTSTQLLSPKQ